MRCAQRSAAQHPTDHTRTAPQLAQSQQPPAYGMELIVVDSEGSEQTLPSPAVVEREGWVEPNRVVRQRSGGSGVACLDPLTPRAVATRRNMSAAALRDMGARRPLSHAAVAGQSPKMELETLSNTSSKSSSRSGDDSPPRDHHEHQTDTRDKTPAGQPARLPPGSPPSSTTRARSPGSPSLRATTAAGPLPRALLARRRWIPTRDSPWSG